MIRKIAIVICIITGLAGIYFRFRHIGRARSVHPDRNCRTNMRTLEGAFKMYAMDSTGVVFDHNGPAFEYADRIIAGKYLKMFPVCKYGQGTYYLIGTPDVTEISCTLHGTNRDYRFDTDYCTWTGQTKKLLEAASVNSRNSTGYTILHWAVFRNLDEICRFLIKNGAGPLARADTERGDTPFHLAVIYESRNVIDTLMDAVGPLRAGQLVNSTDSNGQIPLHHAAAEYSGTMCGALLKAGADIEARDRQGRTPLYYAAEKYSEECLHILLRAGVNSDAADKAGQTPKDLE